jgi:ribosomal protein S6
MDFKMERENLVEIGETVKITEGVLPSSWYYVVEPAVAMSANFSFRERLKAREGVVKEIKQTPRGFYVVVEFEE